MNHQEKALELFKNKFQCSQAVFAAFAAELGVDETTALKISSGFGGGMCCGEVCGAVAGALMAIGLKYGHAQVHDSESKNSTNQKVMEMVSQFKSVNGSIICRELLGYDLTDKRELAVINEKNLFTVFCPKMVASAVDIAETII
ncbi:C-GCAxxG-C-C family protein [Acetobacterium bakii]|uniref:C_GCAxxG_C_C family protein n=2 Tax=Acetobacterium bakii TaxID=52689 RepID=A0A0L6U0I9_9FIRM|nr:C-GCAxxG-C-C family protein [Acetobacterium bakii]KNZ41330.1 hypothetical protein AKG39_12565 [Acetobacterium bakii]